LAENGTPYGYRNMYAYSVFGPESKMCFHLNQLDRELVGWSSGRKSFTAAGGETFDSPCARGGQ
jgi:hypothetical protein